MKNFSYTAIALNKGQGVLVQNVIPTT